MYVDDLKFYKIKKNKKHAWFPMSTLNHGDGSPSISKKQSIMVWKWMNMKYVVTIPRPLPSSKVCLALSPLLLLQTQKNSLLPLLPHCSYFSLWSLIFHLVFLPQKFSLPLCWKLPTSPPTTSCHLTNPHLTSKTQKCWKRSPPALSLKRDVL